MQIRSVCEHERILYSEQFFHLASVMSNWDEIFFAQSWAREQVAVCELVALVLESFEYLNFIGGSRLECDTTRHT